ncbi:hypothetical protein GPICK_10705 [Geobacter pickeringii]|uniref:Sodium:solute symporter n=1 Tax=Geobacter pickeringii TaxID=345632 RepID=A0A0B5BDW4_9BACT|nr:hypothetical protein GPICK_10705 [Geobacter pickeringii]
MKFTNGLFKRLRLRESWVIFFILGVVMLNYPFVQIFNRPDMLAGIPMLYLYFMGGWAISIFVIYLFTKALDLPDDRHDEGGHR